MKLVIQNRGQMEISKYQIAAIKCALKNGMKNENCEKEIRNFNQEWGEKCLKYITEQQEKGADIRIREESACTLNSVIHMTNWWRAVNIWEVDEYGF